MRDTRKTTTILEIRIILGRPCALTWDPNIRAFVMHGSRLGNRVHRGTTGMPEAWTVYLNEALLREQELRNSPGHVDDETTEPRTLAPARAHHQVS